MGRKKKKRPLLPQPRRDWPFKYAMAVLLGILAALSILTCEWSILGVSAIAVFLAYMLKKEWEK